MREALEVEAAARRLFYELGYGMPRFTNDVGDLEWEGLHTTERDRFRHAARVALSEIVEWAPTC